MTLFDTLNGALMTHASAWAFDNPAARRTTLLITGRSGGVALVIGAVTLAQWAGDHFPAAALPALRHVDLFPVGFGLTGLAAALFVGAQYWARREAPDAAR
ncbi:hypothetical protein [Deinococcus taeanensis]|uniref:hypothetical protein n=1 Tax=Deinococcus taeanensis TaxID=2737050 RepID=UPI002103C2F5|nr:hypothetical protein [Deinococcus taeanensis]